MKPLTIAELYNLPAVVDLMTAARALNMGRTLAYELAKAGKFPCRVIRYGDSYRVPTSEILRFLELPVFGDPGGAPHHQDRLRPLSGQPPTSEASTGESATGGLEPSVD
ncbi:helix-turn-helix domain-containing protein [Streptomonospora nanhaiensis]|uniref:helix-turn-helix domain-containing protein n=1 Tax=Streptomonospora nanhaiensis TaxID=1323731 RepID=UPI001C38EEC2|nr:helix-turn-helix domain-containing protein [Streptomonospora nanhaiensis]MBV2364106.1 helix-turn-helix domain-containing protein [Streptomonospora nanhaiensis]MBX9387978.1 helix-turn-helix domain-containing protein [Streptomonospora nanhaiensis]